MQGNNRNAKRLWNIAAAVLLAKVLGTWLQGLWTSVHKPLQFDDAYMFARYAMNIRHGLGISWNLDGVHTYGPTSLLWAGVVVLMSYLPIGTWTMLVLGSWLFSLGAIVAMAWAVAANAKSDLLASIWRVLPLVALPLAEATVFTGNQGTGMETMLAALLAAVFVGLALLWRRGSAGPELVGAIGFLLFLARPESALAVVLLPLLLLILMPSSNTSRHSIATLLGVFAAGVAFDLSFCKLYFHTLFPLSFYMKSRHAYEGYRGVWHPELLMMAFFAGCCLFLVTMILLGRRRDWRLIVCCIAPALAVFAYLSRVTQIMGFNSRYYVPYLAFFVVPALLVIDRWMVLDTETSGTAWPDKMLLTRGCVTAVMMLCFFFLSSEAVLAKVRRAEARSRFEYDPAQLHIAAARPLPDVPWDQTMTAVTDLLIAPLPRGATVAATEVGYLGSRAPQLNIIDLAGLNDTDIALHGFSMKALLARKPDIVWMPNTDYTFQRGVIFSDPALLAQYDVYAGAAKYGLAIRKGSPSRAQIDRQMKSFWDATYPGYSMNDYLVRSAGWTGQKHTIVGE